MLWISAVLVVTDYEMACDHAICQTRDKTIQNHLYCRDVQKTEEPSLLCLLLVVLWIFDYLCSSHRCKTRLWSTPIIDLQWKSDTCSQWSKRQPTLDRAEGSFACCTLIIYIMGSKFWNTLYNSRIKSLLFR